MKWRIDEYDAQKNNNAHPHLFVNQEHELDKRVRDMIREYLWSTVKKRATKSQERVTRVMMTCVSQLGDIEEHDEEIFFVFIMYFLGAYRVLS